MRSCVFMGIFIAAIRQGHSAQKHLEVELVPVAAQENDDLELIGL